MNLEAVSAIVAIVAVIISILTLRQNNKIIYESNKPIIEMYMIGLDIKNEHKYIIIKNFGKTSATINNITFSGKVDSFNDKARLKSLIGTTIAPSQSFSSLCDNLFEGTVNIQLQYSSDYLKKNEIRNFNLNYSQFDSMVHIVNKTKDKSPESEAISNGIEALIKNFK